MKAAPGWMWLCFLAALPIAGIAARIFNLSSTATGLVLLIAAIVIVQVALTFRARSGKRIYPPGWRRDRW